MACCLAASFKYPGVERDTQNYLLTSLVCSMLDTSVVPLHPRCCLGQDLDWAASALNFFLHSIYSISRLTRPIKHVAGEKGVEPLTHRLTAGYSTI